MKGADDITRYTLRLPRELMKRVRHAAADRELSINNTLVELISESLEPDHVASPTP